MNEQRIYQVIYIKATIDMIWEALTNPDVTERYWGGTRIESDWKIGSKILYRRDGEITDEQMILAIETPRRLFHTFHPLFGEFKDEAPSYVNMVLRENGGIVRLDVIHDGFPPDSRVFRACREGWPMILSNLKSLVETGEPLPGGLFGYRWETNID